MSDTDALVEISFPQAFWHVGEDDEVELIVNDVFAQLGLSLSANFLQRVDLDVAMLLGPEDYETGPGSEAWARREQIRRICAAANELLQDQPRQFYQFAEELPGWEWDEPVWLLLSKEERRKLLELGVLSPHPATESTPSRADPLAPAGGDE